MVAPAHDIDRVLLSKFPRYLYGTGFLGNGEKCDNEDECASGSHNCNPMSICTDTEGSFDCTCKQGNID